MKCVTILFSVALILAYGEGAVIPWVIPGGVPVAIAAPEGLAIPGATVVQSNPPPVPVAVVIPAPAPPPAITVDNSSGTPVILASAAPPVVLLPAPPAVVAPAPPAPVATSVSATRGAVHVAPLPGHSVSQQQLNLAPAPGT
ncbi:adult cuticle protein 1-like [Uranotaenia lowii]|uniref:adult cuticle protein 1-like n=1 Tax=Uranotaenia lowii TaxID=190385 RepID=UPI0024787FEA|nr:adult cuticle protein 1-like [Uranotaenia lowii]